MHMPGWNSPQTGSEVSFHKWLTKYTILISTVDKCGKDIPKCVCKNGEEFKLPKELVKAIAE